MATDPGDLVLDPTCGSGTTATVAEQWGRRWITIDTSRVALALARARIMGARYPFYLLADSREGQLKEAEVTRTAPSSQPDARQHPPRLRLRARAAHHAQVHRQQRRDRRHLGKWQAKLEPLREKLERGAEARRGRNGRFRARPMPSGRTAAKKLHADWWEARIARQKEIDASIAAKAEFEYLYDKPYEDKKKVRVAGPFTVESLTPHRVLGVDENDELIDRVESQKRRRRWQGRLPADDPGEPQDRRRAAGAQGGPNQLHLARRPGRAILICAEGRYLEGDDSEKRAAIFIGPEFGTVPRADLVAAAREAAMPVSMC